MVTKKKYRPPMITHGVVFLEQGICVGSACVKPQTENDVVQEWDDDTDVNKNFEWDW